MEIWKEVPSVFPLEASSLGRVRSKPYLSPMPNGGFRVVVLNPQKGSQARPRRNSKHIRLHLSFKKKTYKMHQLVAEAFLGPRPEGYVVYHIDEDAMNNKSDNLKYTTRAENCNSPKYLEYLRSR